MTPPRFKLAFPLDGATNRPVYDAEGRLVSCIEHAELFTKAANLVAELADDFEHIPKWLQEKAAEIVAQPVP